MCNVSVVAEWTSTKLIDDDPNKRDDKLPHMHLAFYFHSIAIGIYV
jgi:hypothetical protein